MLMEVCVQMFRPSEHIKLSNFLINPKHPDSQLNRAVGLRKPILRLSCYFVPAQDGSTQIPEVFRWLYATKELDHMLHPYSTNEKRKLYKRVQKGLCPRSKPHLGSTKKENLPTKFALMFSDAFMNMVCFMLTVFFLSRISNIFSCRRKRMRTGMRCKQHLLFLVPILNILVMLNKVQYQKYETIESL